MAKALRQFADKLMVGLVFLGAGFQGNYPDRALLDRERGLVRLYLDFYDHNDQAFLIMASEAETMLLILLSAAFLIMGKTFSR